MTSGTPRSGSPSRRARTRRRYRCGSDTRPSGTLDTYGHLLDGLDDRLAEDVERDLARHVEDTAAH